MLKDLYPISDFVAWGHNEFVIRLYINKRYPLSVYDQEFREKHGRMVTLEFILIDGVNDSLEQAKALVKIAKRLHAHMNYSYNKVEA